MDHIQRVSLDLFEERGFDAVTIEEIADAAEVSARSIYRYFQTKEGLILRDALDAQFLEMVPDLLAATRDLSTAVRQALSRFSTELQGAELTDAIEQSTRRLHVWMTTPSLRVAGLGIADEMARELAAAMVAAKIPGRSAADCHIQAAALMFGFFAALEEWYAAGMQEDVIAFAERVLDLLEG